jgi:dolichol kinase
LILAISDPIAALMGKTWPIGKFNIGNIHKTLIGSASFFISATLLTFFTFTPTLATTLIQAVLVSAIIAVIATVVEAISTKGYDNLTIPLAVLAALYAIPYMIE